MRILLLLSFLMLLGSCMPDFTRLLVPPTSPGSTALPPVIEYVACDTSATMVRGLEISKMNVVYIGVDNPIKFELNYKYDREDIEVYTSGGAGAGLTRGGKNTYNLTATRPGAFQINIRDKKKGLKTTYDMRAKRMPDPVAMVNLKSGGAIGVGEFRASGGVGAFLNNFDFEAMCKIQGFMLNRITKDGQPRQEVVNRGARYSNLGKPLIDAAMPGDIYTFHNVKAKCPGDLAGRKINSMVFFVK